MKELSGISASPGIAIGSAFLYIDVDPAIPKYDIPADKVAREYDRFIEAVGKASEEIDTLKIRTSDEMGEVESRFLDSHILMLNDSEFHDQVRRNLSANKKTAEWILCQVIEEMTGKLDLSQDVYLRERSIDFYDVSKRVLNHLLRRERISLADLSHEVILVMHDLLPSEALLMNKRMVKGIAMDAGGKTSHTAILARSFEIPAVLGLSRISRDVRSGEEIIVDGQTGKVIVSPDRTTRDRYLRIQQEWEKREVQLLNLNELPAETTDGKRIELNANIEVPEETESVKAHGADGIGLYRSEFLFSNQSPYNHPHPPRRRAVTWRLCTDARA